MYSKQISGQLRPRILKLLNLSKKKYPTETEQQPLSKAEFSGFVIGGWIIRNLWRKFWGISPRCLWGHTMAEIEVRRNVQIIRIKFVGVKCRPTLWKDPPVSKPLRIKRIDSMLWKCKILKITLLMFWRIVNKLVFHNLLI